MEFCFSRHHPHLMIFLNFLKITVELLYNKEPSDLQNLFAKISYCSVEDLFHYVLLLLG